MVPKHFRPTTSTPQFCRSLKNASGFPIPQNANTGCGGTRPQRALFITVHAAVPKQLGFRAKSLHVRELLNQLHFGRAETRSALASIPLPLRGARGESGSLMLPAGNSNLADGNGSTPRAPCQRRESTQVLKSVVKKEQVNGVLGFNSLPFLVTVRPNPKNHSIPEALFHHLNFVAGPSRPAISASQNRHPFVLLQKSLR
jgi:hypothetical protein